VRGRESAGSNPLPAINLNGAIFCTA